MRERAGSGGSWDEVLQSGGFQTYESTLVGGAGAYREFQATLDATADRGVFADTPWIPGEMKQIADVVIGCGAIPECLDEVFGQ